MNLGLLVQSVINRDELKQTKNYTLKKFKKSGVVNNNADKERCNLCREEDN